MSGINRAARGSIKVPWSAFGYDRLPERFSRALPGSKRKKKTHERKEWKIVRGDLVSIKDLKCVANPAWPCTVVHCTCSS